MGYVGVAATTAERRFTGRDAASADGRERAAVFTAALALPKREGAGFSGDEKVAKSPTAIVAQDVAVCLKSLPDG